MPDAFDSLLPVATLLLGAGLANLLKFSELRRGLRLDAADQLAEIPALLWNKADPDSWIKLNSALSRLSIRLNLAGVHPDLIERVQDSAIAFWSSAHVVDQNDEGDIWTVGEDAGETWAEASTVVAELLGTNSRVKSWWVSRRVRRLLKMWDEQERALLASVEKAGA
jgi:hypothetical protein